MAPRVSIILCTFNRANFLRRTLAQLVRVEVPSHLPTELLIVDNGSTDDTPGVVASAHLPCMQVRYIEQRRRGKSHAYNKGLAEAQGEFLLCSDDDVHPPANWIHGMCEPMLSGEADAVAGGVRIAPHLDRPWLRGKLRAYVACTDELNAADPRAMFGANMGFARHVLSNVPGFDPELGPGPEGLGFGEETLFCAQLRAAGYKIAGRLNIVAEHHFDPTRLNRRSLLLDVYRRGRSHAYIDYHWAHESYHVSPQVRVLMRLGLWWRRVAFLKDCIGTEFAADWEWMRVQRSGYCRQYDIESQRSRNYEFKGLRKLRGLVLATDSEPTVCVQAG